MKLPCAVVRDILPLYAEDMTEEETKRLVKEHLDGCEECREKLRLLSQEDRTPVDAGGPLKAIKKEITVRRLLTAALAALIVFIGVFAFFHHAGRVTLTDWHDGLITVEGIRTQEDGAYTEGGTEALVLKTDGSLSEVEKTVYEDEDGKSTVILTGYSPVRGKSKLVKSYGEIRLSPVPDRVVYSSTESSELLWGDEMDGDVITLPRLAPAFYLLAAAALALVSGALWLLIRYRRSVILLQVFFAPLAYLLAHVIIMGFSARSYSLERDFIGIVVIAAALYALFTVIRLLLSRRNKA